MGRAYTVLDSLRLAVVEVALVLDDREDGQALVVEDVASALSGEAVASAKHTAYPKEREAEVDFAGGNGLGLEHYWGRDASFGCSDRVAGRDTAGNSTAAYILVPGVEPLGRKDTYTGTQELAPALVAARLRIAAEAAALVRIETRT